MPEEIYNKKNHVLPQPAGKPNPINYMEIQAFWGESHARILPCFFSIQRTVIHDHRMHILTLGALKMLVATWGCVRWDVSLSTWLYMMLRPTCVMGWDVGFQAIALHKGTQYIHEW